MRVPALLLAAGCLLATPTWSANVTFPYTAEISVDSAAVRCGPGTDFYPTLQLERGAKVEVHRHDPGGWLAIRPPEDSFSWIPARQVERGSETQVGKVLIEGAVAWVGSSAVDVRQHKWQVRLERGERLQILGEESLSMGAGFATETHLKIAPPAGEFRWISAEHVSTSGSLTPPVSADGTDRTKPTRNHSARSSEPAVANKAVAKRDGTSPEELTDEKRQALRKRIDQLNLDLSMLVSDQIDKWDLQPLKERANTLADAVQGTALYRQVRLIAHRIREFETVQQRHRRVRERGERDTETARRIERHGVPAAPRRRPGNVEPTNWQREIEASLENNERDNNTLGNNKIVGTGLDKPVPKERKPSPSFDAEGWLMPVHATRRLAPPFAVLDNQGRVICYARPSPGLNLRRYAKKHVGLFGDKRRVPALKASLLTVTRVVNRDN
ncbi:MAG: hypothetical protein ACQESR_31145 [Planctomycetota bacterium]